MHYEPLLANVILLNMLVPQLQLHTYWSFLGVCRPVRMTNVYAISGRAFCLVPYRNDKFGLRNDVFELRSVLRQTPDDVFGQGNGALL